MFHRPLFCARMKCFSVSMVVFLRVARLMADPEDVSELLEKIRDELAAEKASAAQPAPAGS